jgi:hypothetical protein
MTNFLISFPKPYEIRASPSGKGLHLRSKCTGCPRTNERKDCYLCWVYQQFDDQKRLKLDILQRNYGLCHNILNDVKNGRQAGKWIQIKDCQQLDIFLRQFTGFY